MSRIGFDKSPVFVLTRERASRGTDRGLEERVVQVSSSLILLSLSHFLFLSLWLPSTDIPLFDLKPTQTFGHV